jgi:hypothetical protein
MALGTLMVVSNDSGRVVGWFCSTSVVSDSAGRSAQPSVRREHAKNDS